METRIGLVLLATTWLLACSEAGGRVTSISPEALLAAGPANALILDVRTPGEFGSSHVPGAVNVPHGEVAARLAELGTNRDRPVIVYCESGRRAGLAEALLIEAGFSDVRHLEGDMRAWREAGRPTEKP